MTKLSERLSAMCSDFEHMGVNELTVSMDAIREAIELARRVEGAETGQAFVGCQCPECGAEFVASGAPSFGAIESVCKALTKLGVSVPESKEEQAARADELVEELARKTLAPPSTEGEPS